MMVAVAATNQQREKFARKTESLRRRGHDRCTCLAPEFGTLTRTELRAQHRRNSYYCRSVRPSLVVDVVVTPPRLWTLPTAGRPYRWFSCSPFHDPARLRPWFVVPPSASERLDRSRDWRVHINPL